MLIIQSLTLKRIFLETSISDIRQGSTTTSNCAFLLRPRAHHCGAHSYESGAAKFVPSMQSRWRSFRGDDDADDNDDDDGADSLIIEGQLDSIDFERWDEVVSLPPQGGRRLCCQ